jgi:hypothetical protein
MNRKGFALLPSLWLLVVIAILVGAALEDARLSVTATRNRLSLARAEWAREACVSILKSRYHRYRADTLRLIDDRLSGRVLETMSLDSIPLGKQLWCRTVAVDAGATVVSTLPPDVRLLVTSAFDVFSAIATTVPPQLVINVVGGAGAPALEARLTLVALTGGTDLLILERGTE